MEVNPSWRSGNHRYGSVQKNGQASISNELLELASTFPNVKHQKNKRLWTICWKEWCCSPETAIGASCSSSVFHRIYQFSTTVMWNRTSSLVYNRFLDQNCCCLLSQPFMHWGPLKPHNNYILPNRSSQIQVRAQSQTTSAYTGQITFFVFKENMQNGAPPLQDFNETNWWFYWAFILGVRENVYLCNC